jgi:hypothetical protein
VCADARGLEREFWSTYALRTLLAGRRGPRLSIPVRAFTSANAKRNALLAAVRSAADRGEALLVVLRSPPEAQASMELLQQAGLNPGVLRGLGGEAGQRELEALEAPGAVVVALPPAESRVLRAPGKVALRLVVVEAHDPLRHLQRLGDAFAAASCELLLSLEDETVARLAGAAALSGLRLVARQELPGPVARWLARLVLRRAGKTRALAREEALSREQYLSDLLAFSGSRD